MVLKSWLNDQTCCCAPLNIYDHHCLRNSMNYYCIIIATDRLSFKCVHRDYVPSLAVFCKHTLRCTLLSPLFTSRHLCNYLSQGPLPFSFPFFCDLEQSAVQLFKELSNPALDLSRAWWHNRIVVLTLMAVPPAVAEPPVGHQEECVREAGRGSDGAGMTGIEIRAQIDRD